MPNWCDCDLNVVGKTKEVNGFIAFAETKKGGDVKEYIAIDTNNFIPYPKRFKELDEKAREHNSKVGTLKGKAKEKFKMMKDGFNSGGYDWCLQNWGTKWGICDSEKQEEYGWEGKEDKEVIYKFQTAWSPPNPIILRMSKLFPDLEFEMRYFEGGGGFNGIYRCKNGEVQRDEQGDYFGDRGG